MNQSALLDEQRTFSDMVASASPVTEEMVRQRQFDTIMPILSIVLGVLFIVLLFIIYSRVMPNKYDGTFKNKTHQFLHNYFNFKKLYIENVLKFVFVVATLGCVYVGLVGFLASVFSQIDLYMALSYLAIMVLGPIIIRLAYESIMMFMLLVKNVIEINIKTM